MSKEDTDKVGGGNGETQRVPASTAHDPGRRQFVAHAAATAAAAGAATLGFPTITRAAEPITLKFQTTWLVDDIFYEYARDYGRIVNEMSGGRLRLSVLPAAAVAGTLSMQDAVNSGALDGGHSVATWYDRNKAYSLFGTPPPFGWDANTMLGWMKYGGGQALYDELLHKILGLDLVGFITGPMPSQPLGWFRKEVKSVADLKRLRYRTAGLAVDVMREMGVDVVTLGSADIVPAMKRGALDAAEFNNPSSDRARGFPEVARTYMLRSYHQSAECAEILFNRTRYASLPGELQTILRLAAEAHAADMAWKAMDRYPKDLQALEAQWGVKVVETPEPILKAQLRAWDKVIARLAQDPFSARVIASQKAWSKRVVGYQLRNDPSRRLAYDHFFPA
jgi:TRAP-type mannitol/chloroaromatic compound transport system substrate-binding protein